MSKKKKNVEDFFNDYELHFNNAMSGKQSDLEDQIRKSFADCFIESSPLGVNCGKNDDEFRKKIRQGFDFYKKIGSTGMNILSKDITVLDDLHAMAKIYWRYSYSKDNKLGTIDFHIIYFLTMLNNEIKIFSYIAGDEQKALKEKGLIPEEEFVSDH